MGNKFIYDNGAVRRQDRLLEEERAAELLREAEYGVLSMTDEDGEAYGVPLNFVWDEAGFACENDGAGAIYIHCATEGKKLRAIARNAAVSFCIVGNVKPQPENLTTLYESIILKGKARVGLPDEERRNALRLLVRKFAPEEIEHGERSIEKSFHRTEIIRIDIEHVSGKTKRPKH